MTLLDELARDARFAVRSLRRTPGVAIAAVIALALGIGATTAMLSVVNAVLLRPLPYADADRLVVVLHGGNDPVAPANFADWRRQSSSFSAMAAAEAWSPDITGTDDPEHVTGLRVTSGMLPMLGVRPLLGRVFTDAEEIPGAEHVVVISHGLWQRRFAADPRIVGSSILLNGDRFTIVGVMPESFRFAPFWATHAELWAPLALAPRIANRNAQSLRVFARLKPGVTVTQARGDVAALTARLERDYPGSNRDVQVVPLKEKVVGNIRAPLVVMFVAVAFVLLIACANVAHVLLARAASRQRELAVRTALGATQARLVSQLLVESALLALVGGIGGFALAVWGIRALVAASPAILPAVAHVSVDARVLAMTMGITCCTALLFGLVPALRATRVDIADAFRDGDRASSEGRGRGTARATLVASEFALALVLLAGAGLMIRSFVALQRIDPGFDARNVLTMTISTVGTPAADSTRHAAFLSEALTRVRALPRVESASFINHLPLAGDAWGTPFAVDGRVASTVNAPRATYRVVFPGYFDAMRQPLLRGRDISESDRADAAPVIVINEFMARTHWPGENAVGKRVVLGDSTRATVVGVVKNAVRERWSAAAEPEMYFPFMQQRGYVAGVGPRAYMTLVVRVACPESACDAGMLAESVKHAVRSVEPRAPIAAVQTMNSVVEHATAEQRFYLVLLASFAALALVLASVGIYGVTSYAVARRTHEIGIRMALGADHGRVVGDVLRDAMRIALAGSACGGILALLLTRSMRGFLYGVGAGDPLTFAVVAISLLATGAAASYVPARRATRIDPLEALRAD